jgi:hypothetical protein
MQQGQVRPEPDDLHVAIHPVGTAISSSESAIYAQRAVRALDASSPCVTTPAALDSCWLRTTASDSASDAIAEPVRLAGPTETPQALACGRLTTGSPQTKRDYAAHGGTFAMMAV